MASKIASLVIAMVLVPASLSAQVVISEILYDLSEGSDSGREWIEIYNEGSEAVDITEWKFFENNTNHGITETNGALLQPGVYAVIADNPAKFKVDWPSFSGLLFDSAFSLNNTGETLVLRCCGKELADKDSIAYSSELGGAGDGNSLSRSGATLVPTAQTPGASPSAAKSVAEKKELPPPQSKKLPEPPPPQPEPEPEKEQKQETEQKSVVLTETTSSEPAKKVESKKLPTPAPAPAEIVEADVGDEETLPPTEEDTKEPQSLQVAAVAESTQESDLAWFAGAAAVALFGAAAGYFVAKRRKTEWDIVEEK